MRREKKSIDILPFSGQAYDPVPEDDGIFEQTHFSVINDSIDKMKMLTHRFERSDE